MDGKDHDRDRFVELCHHVIGRCGRAGFVAPSAWVEWLLRLELDAVAKRTGTSAEEAARAMTLREASSIADELMEVARSSAGEPSDLRDTSLWN